MDFAEILGNNLLLKKKKKVPGDDSQKTVQAS